MSVYCVDVVWVQLVGVGVSTYYTGALLIDASSGVEVRKVSEPRQQP